MGSAHPLVEVNLSFKIEGNPSIGKGVIERTRIGDRRTEAKSESSIAPHTHTFCGGGIIKALKSQLNVKNNMYLIQYTCTRLKVSNSNFEFQKPCECFVLIYTVNATNITFKTRLIFPQNLKFNIMRIKLNMPKY